ncbi:hypothetical protein Hanom_Chr13g01235941 [Helianthus anomalus]
MAMGICRQGSLSDGELGREIPSAVRGTVQLPFFKFILLIIIIRKSNLLDVHFQVEKIVSENFSIDEPTHF